MDIDEVSKTLDFKEIARTKLDPDIFEYIEGGADDSRTSARNAAAYSSIQLRPRRLVDVSVVDPSFKVFGEDLAAPLLVAPLGFQGMFHPDGELATVRAAAAEGLQMMVSTVSNYSYKDISEASPLQPWFQLYPTDTRKGTAELIKRVEKTGCKTLVLTIDLPVLGNRAIHRAGIIQATERKKVVLGNFDNSKGDELFNDPSISWDIIDWIREITGMNLVLKGIMTGEDAAIALKNGVDGIIVSNHGGRQLESDLSTIECLEEIVGIIDKKIPVLIDGGIYRGTDIIKALALGADAVCIGRAFCYGLASFGQQGVQKVLQILKTELIRDMQLLGVRTVSDINRNFVRKKVLK